MRDSGWVGMAGRERCDGGRTGMESGMEMGWMDWQVRVVGEERVMQRGRVHAASAAAAAEDRAQSDGLDDGSLAL